MYGENISYKSRQTSHKSVYILYLLIETHIDIVIASLIKQYTNKIIYNIRFS